MTLKIVETINNKQTISLPALNHVLYHIYKEKLKDNNNICFIGTKVEQHCRGGKLRNTRQNY